MNESKVAIVIGGGPAGLTAAARLAAGGAETTLLEAASGLGGRASTERRGGFDLNQGPHALYAGGPAMRELEAMGIDPPRWNPASRHSVFVRGGRARRTPGGTAGLARWLLGASRLRPEELGGTSVAEWLRQTVPSARARAAAAAVVRVATFTADHDSLSADVAAGQLKIGVSSGVRYLRGGWQTLVDELARVAVGEGASVRTHAAVRELRREADGWRVRTDEETFRADVVVLATGGPEVAAKLLGADAPPASGPAAEVSAFDLGLRKLPRPGRRFAVGIDRPTYLSRHTPPDHRGDTLLSLATYGRSSREVLEEMADVVQPGWRGEATMERFLPRMVAVSAIATPASGGLAGRPSVERGAGLYLAGDWIGPEGWLVDAAILSGAAAAAAALASREPALA